MKWSCGYPCREMLRVKKFTWAQKGPPNIVERCFEGYQAHLDQEVPKSQVGILPPDTLHMPFLVVCCWLMLGGLWVWELGPPLCCAEHSRETVLGATAGWLWPCVDPLVTSSFDMWVVILLGLIIKTFCDFFFFFFWSGVLLCYPK